MLPKQLQRRVLGPCCQSVRAINPVKTVSGERLLKEDRGRELCGKRASLRFPGELRETLEGGLIDVQLDQ